MIGGAEALQWPVREYLLGSLAVLPEPDAETGVEVLVALIRDVVMTLAWHRGVSPRTVADELFSALPDDAEWRSTLLPYIHRQAAEFRARAAESGAQ